ncbi:hypothetical protein K492DRAFT_184629 [Lichtheimia hyalospora FSU 10163]|nr:hypothetical protein K492DRAFT_184629 [Lichtheimia hyalospora FSU 10163]
MNFKLSLFITIAIGALMVAAAPPPPPQPVPGPDEQGSAEGPVQKPKNAGESTPRQRAHCFIECMHLGIKEGEQCYEDCLKKATSAQGAGDQPSDTTTSADQARGAGMTK